MGRLPCYGIIGDGRVAKHMRHYLDLLGLAWQDGPAELNLVLVSDAAIAEVAATVPGPRLHFSGSQIIPGCPAAHPLYSFTHELYDEACYRCIPFVVDSCAPSPPLPGLPNPTYRISKDKRPLYHAFCVLAGNFSCLLWERLFAGFEDELDLAPDVAFPYLQRIACNLQESRSALTGPLVRNDTDTIERNLKALAQDPYQEVYRAFLSAWHKTQRNPHEQFELSPR